MEFSRFRCSEVWYPPSTACPSCVPELASIEIILAGTGTQSLLHRVVDAGEGTVLYHPSGCERGGCSGSDGVASILLEIQPDAEYAELLPRAPLLHRGGALLAAAVRMRTELAASDSVARLAVKGLALTMMAELRRQEQRRRFETCPSWLPAVLERIESSCVQPLRIESVAASVNLNRSYFARAFRQHTGMTVADYVRRLRMDIAIALLLTSTRPIVEVALACGYNDQPHFTRVFKETVGLPPGEYRAAHGPADRTARDHRNKGATIHRPHCITTSENNMTTARLHA